MARSNLGLICTTIVGKTLDDVVEKANQAFGLGTEMVELRVDKLTSHETPTEIARRLRRFGPKAILTVRSKEQGGGFRGSEDERLRLISSLSRGLRPAYLDLELETARGNTSWVSGLGKKGSGPGKTIISWHELGGTPSLEALRKIRGEASSLGDVAKIVTTARSADDNLRVLALYRDSATDLIAFCMGSEGVSSRVLSLQLGSPIVYASLPGEPAAPGQLSIVTVRTLKTMITARARASR